MGFFVCCIPEEELEFWFFRYGDREMLLLLSERFCICDRHILDEPEGTRIAYAIGSELVYLFESCDGDMCWEERTLYIEYLFWEICYIVNPGD